MCNGVLNRITEMYSYPGIHVRGVLSYSFSVILLFLLSLPLCFRMLLERVSVGDNKEEINR